MKNEFEAKDIIIDMFNKSELNAKQKDATIKELADYYNMTYHDFLKEDDVELKIENLNKMTAEQFVKTKVPKAEAKLILMCTQETEYHILNGKFNIIGCGKTESKAWEDAKKKLKSKL